MPEISWSVNIQVQPDGSRLSETKLLKVGSCNRTDVSIQAKQEDEVQVGGGAGQLQFLLIKSNAYSDGEKALSYSINREDGKRLRLDQLHVFVGNDVVALLDKPLTRLYFHNDLEKDVSITILVGRTVPSAQKAASSRSLEPKAKPSKEPAKRRTP